MYRKNTAGQFLGFGLVNVSTGAALIGATVTVYRSIDNAAQAAATGTVSEKGNGQYIFAPSQADTNGSDISFLFTATSAIPVEKTIVTTVLDPTSSAFGLSLAKTTNITGFNDITAASVASLILVTPANLLTTDANGKVTLAPVTHTGAVIPRVTVADTCTANTDMRGTNNALLASGYTAPDNADILLIKTVTDKLGTSLQADGSSGYQFTTLALAHAPTGGSGGATAADIWAYASRTLSDKAGFSLASTGLDSIAVTSQAGPATTFPGMLVQLWRWFLKPGSRTLSAGVGSIKLFADDGVTPLLSQPITSDGAGNETKGAAT